MRAGLGLLTLLLFAGPSVSFFKYERVAPAPNTPGQHYVVVDEAVWQHARPDLGDLRLYSGGGEIGYSLDVERGSAEIEQREVRVLQPAVIGGKTQFLLDMSGVGEYDRVALRIATKNFLGHARVSGQDDPHGSRWALLGTTTLYDLSAERLGHNGTLQIPRATYNYLEVVIDNSVKPSEVLGATAGITRSEKAVWRSIGSVPTITKQGKDTVLTFTVGPGVPMERIVFEIDPRQPNFRRDVEIEGTARNPMGSGEIARVHMQRGGQKIDLEQTSANMGGRGPEKLSVIVHNGDDPPLKIRAAHLEQYERRIYFDAPGSAVRLYYGDAPLGAPIYDYAKLFQKDANADAVELGAETSNSDYKGRPDGRPWSERHPAVLWAAIIAAVLVLGALAVKSMRSAAA